MSGAFYNVPWISRLVYPCVSLDCVSLCEPASSAVVEAHIGILFAGSSAAARSGRPAWKKCWCVLESGLPSAATTTFLINHTFHLSNPPWQAELRYDTKQGQWSNKWWSVTRHQAQDKHIELERKSWTISYSMSFLQDKSFFLQDIHLNLGGYIAQAVGSAGKKCVARRSPIWYPRPNLPLIDTRVSRTQVLMLRLQQCFV